MSNLYYYPETFGLTQVFANNIADSYKFDIFAVWKDAEENYYFARDSGCSCPSPFENYNSISDLTPIKVSNIYHFEQEASRHLSTPEIRQVRQAVYKKHYGRPQGQTKRQRDQQLVSKKLNELAEELGNKVFAIETNLETAIRRLKTKGSHMACPEGFEPLESIKESLEQLKEIKGMIGE